ncbi:squalene/phytoene synthase family protein [Halovenus sp. WSH3]|uniref:Squalene/phytoene synthase family protein n=1 Tax=Halovenus carboxidivorans TaxID=2692199 RepID=A0A6B0T9R1_9EURY|nr:squalene/phytoene synthase family protein [Halovenus carboxidivorans]
MVNTTQRDRGKAIHRETGQTFYYATRLLPERIREQTYVLYGFFRVADEVVDDGSEQSPDRQRERLEEIRAAALGDAPAEEPVIEAFSEIRAEEGIADEEVDEFIDAMCADIETDRYETYEDLKGYMRGSAAAVGNMMTTIMNADNPEKARPHAMALGEAFQLTNFLRDVREDIRELDRIYLPMETLDRYGVSPEQIEREEPSPEFRRAIQSELRRAEQRYREGVAGIEYLPEDCQFAVVLAAVLYAEHHRLIRKQDYDVLSTRPELSKPRKLYLVAKTWWNWRRYEDPVTVFRRVSAVPADETTSDDAEHGVPSVK